MVDTIRDSWIDDFSRSFDYGAGFCTDDFEEIEFKTDVPAKNLFKGTTWSEYDNPASLVTHTPPGVGEVSGGFGFVPVDYGNALVGMAKAEARGAHGWGTLQRLQENSAAVINE